MDFNDIGKMGGSGLFGALCAFLGINWRLGRIEKDLESHKQLVVYTKTFEAYEKNIVEIREDVRKLFEVNDSTGKKLEKLIGYLEGKQGQDL